MENKIEQTEIIENVEVEVVDEIPPQKYYTISIVGLQYGTLIRKTGDYSKALRIYKDLKETFSTFNCNVVLTKHLIQDGEEMQTIIYNKTIGDGYNIKLQLEHMLNTIDSIDRMKRMYNNTFSEADKYVSAVRHVLEETNTEDLSDETIRQIIRGMEEQGALRRISKKQLEYINSLTQNLASVRSNLNKCLETCKKLDYHTSTEKAKANSEAKSKEYREILGLDI